MAKWLHGCGPKVGMVMWSLPLALSQELLYCCQARALVTACVGIRRRKMAGQIFAVTAGSGGLTRQSCVQSMDVAKWLHRRGSVVCTVLWSMRRALSPPTTRLAVRRGHSWQRVWGSVVEKLMDRCVFLLLAAAGSLSKFLCAIEDIPNQSRGSEKKN